MIRVNFCKTGASVSDWDIDEKVQFLRKIALQHSRLALQSEWIYDFSNFLLFDALRAEVAEGKISLDNICFSVDDVSLEVNRYGRCGSIDRQEKNLNYITRTLVASTKIYEKERKIAKLAKTTEEGQAPVSDRNSTTSGDS